MAAAGAESSSCLSQVDFYQEDRTGHFPEVWVKNEPIEDGDWEHQLMVIRDPVDEIEQYSLETEPEKMSPVNFTMRHTAVKIECRDEDISIEEHFIQPNDDWFITGQADSPKSVSSEWDCVEPECLESGHPSVNPVISTKTTELLKYRSPSNHSAIGKRTTYNSKKINTFSCGKCGRRFPTRSGVLRHERTHVKENPFKCDNCRKSFVQYRSLLRHLQTHTVQKGYKCFVCCKVFPLHSGLLKHVVNHQKEVEPKVKNDFYYNAHLHGYFHDHDYHIKIGIAEDKLGIQTPNSSDEEEIDVESVDDDIFYNREMLLVSLGSKQHAMTSPNKLKQDISDHVLNMCSVKATTNRSSHMQKHMKVNPSLDDLSTMSDHFSKRISHNTKERQRRMNLREQVEGLRVLLPKLKSTIHVSTLTILSEATQYCRELQIQAQRRIVHVAHLGQINKRLSVRLSQLTAFFTSKKLSSFSNSIKN